MNSNLILINAFGIAYIKTNFLIKFQYFLLFYEHYLNNNIYQLFIFMS